MLIFNLTKIVENLETKNTLEKLMDRLDRKVAKKHGINVINFNTIANVIMLSIFVIIFFGIFANGKYGFGQYKIAGEVVESGSVLVDYYVYNNVQLTKLVERSIVLDTFQNTYGYRNIKYNQPGTRFDSLFVAAALEPLFDSVFDWQVYTKKQPIDNSQNIIFKSDFWETYIMVDFDMSSISNTNTWLGSNPYIKWNAVWDNKHLYYVPVSTDHPFTFFGTFLILIALLLTWGGSYLLGHMLVTEKIEKLAFERYIASYVYKHNYVKGTLSSELERMRNVGDIERCKVFIRGDTSAYIFYSYKKMKTSK
jgi:hypothetical protein